MAMLKIKHGLMTVDTVGNVKCTFTNYLNKVTLNRSDQMGTLIECNQHITATGYCTVIW